MTKELFKSLVSSLSSEKRRLIGGLCFKRTSSSALATFETHMPSLKAKNQQKSENVLSSTSHHTARASSSNRFHMVLVRMVNLFTLK